MAERSPLAIPASSRTLGRYELIAEIASGGMGTVVLARLAGAGGFQRLFAIKLLHAEYASDERFVEMLLDEARIAARIHHPNVVPILEIQEDSDHGYYLVMDYVDGFSLWDIVQRKLPAPGSWRATHRTLLDALAGLHAAHTLCDDDGRPLGVVHRDVSPQNILVGIDGIARVTDFGVAKAVGRLQQTRAGQAKGKLGYMAPEQARGLAVDARADLFALGIVLWEALAGRRLFKRSTEMATYQALTALPVPRVRGVRPEVPPSLDAVCARALERDPGLRFQTAREMAHALEEAAREHGLLGDADEVARQVGAAFAVPIATRRAAIRAAANHAPEDSTIVPRFEPGHGLGLPQLPITLTESSVDLSAELIDDDSATTRLPEGDRLAALALHAAMRSGPAPLPPPRPDALAGLEREATEPDVPAAEAYVPLEAPAVFELIASRDPLATQRLPPLVAPRPAPFLTPGVAVALVLFCAGGVALGLAAWHHAQSTHAVAATQPAAPPRAAPARATPPAALAPPRAPAPLPPTPVPARPTDPTPHHPPAARPRATHPHTGTLAPSELDSHAPF